MKIHFIGIGGIGLSGLAKFLHFEGHKISGSDLNETLITKELKNMGIDVYVPHSKDAIKDQDLVIHSAIIKETNIEYMEAKSKNIELIARRESLLKILNNKEVYSVAGAHGKSTTSSILTAIMSGNAIVGAESKDFKSNVRYDKNSNRVIFEADESDGSFLNSNPYCSIVTNAEPEHMEYYKYDYDKFYNAYKSFIDKAKIRVINAEDDFLSTYEDDAIRLYPSKDITNIKYLLIDDEPHTNFTLKDLGEFSVWGFGEHIALDASLAILAAMQSMDIEDIRKKILNFKGIKKRFDIVKKESNSVFIDDYAHHPTEIKATISSVKEYAKLKKFDKITAIWQPHKYSRTIDNMKEFIECFKGIDRLIILPVYAVGEKKQNIDFEKEFSSYNLILADIIKRDKNILNIIKDDNIIKSLDDGLVIGFGAGDITNQIRGLV